MTDADAKPAGPLAGLRVIELAGIGPGPFAGMLLADMGADVLRLERPRGSASVVPPHLDVLRRGKRSVTIDLHSSSGVEAVLQLVENADALIEGYRPGVTERIGVGPEQCWERNARIVYGRMTGWGQDGPLAASAGHDIGYIALTGALSAIGRAGESPAVPLNLVGDFGGGSTYLVMGVLAAIIEARRSGVGQVVDAAIVDGAAALIAPMHGMLAAGMWNDARGTNLLDTGVPWYDVYETADQQWMAVGAIEPQFYAEFVRLLDIDSNEGERADPASWPGLRERIATAFRGGTRDEWSLIFEGTDACVAPVLGLREATRHPHLAARQTFIAVDGVTQPAPAPRFSRTPSSVRHPPPALGAHTREALTEWGVRDLDQLLASGAVIQS
jgi:alpha-methylacyl-CoA racemase